jgi:hypothetical protein
MPGTQMLAGLTSKVAGLGVVAKVGLGASLAAAGVAGAGVAGALPAAADHAVRDAIETVSPLDLAEPGDGAPDRFGARVSADATGESDGDKGVDGPTIAAEAPGADHRNGAASGASAGSRGSAAPDEPPGQTGATGLTRANQTTAAPHAPDTPPSTSPPHRGPDDPGDDHPAPGGPAGGHGSAE